MSHLTSIQLSLQRLRRNSRRDPVMSLVSYQSVEGGTELAWAGDEEAPFVKPISDGGALSLNVQGAIAHDEPDVEANNFPVKVGAHASANPRVPAVAEDDVTDFSADLQGRIRVRISGSTEANVAADVPLDPANALQVGGQTAHDSPDEGNPIKIGGRAASETPAAVAAADRVNQYYTLESRLVNVQDLGNAGEDLVNEVVRQVPGALAVEEHSLDQNYLAGSATNAVVKSTAGRAYQFYVYNPTGGSLTFQLHNLAAAPGGGAVPVMTPFTLATLTALFIDFGEYGFYCSVGITVGSSSVYATFTGSAGLHITTLFK